MIDRIRAQPRHVGVHRALTEAFGGYACLIVLSVAVRPLYVVSLLWLAIWPAWRLERLRGQSKTLRVIAGIFRGIATGLTLAAVAGILARALWQQMVPRLAESPLSPWGQAVLVLVLFCFVHSVIVLVTIVRRYTRRRLRRQLMASQFALVLLLVVGMTGTASIASVALGLQAIRTNPAEMAVSVRQYLLLADVIQPPNPRRLRAAIEQITAGKVSVKGQPVLSRITSRAIPPTFIAVVRPNGSAIVDVHSANDSRRNRRGAISLSWANQRSRYPKVWSHLLAAARRGATASDTIQSSELAPFRPVIGEAPVFDSAHRLSALVVVYAAQPSLTSLQVLQSTVAFFGLATLVLLLSISLPVLLLSFLVSWFVARGLTRNVESVSAVATAIASGDLSQRAPSAASNEIGALADNVNRMAGHLDTAMEELRNARKGAENALRDRQTLVANISHELRTPLAIIRAHLEALSARAPVTVGRPDGELSDISVPGATMHALESETERLAGLIDDLFSLSRAEAGGLEILRVPVDVGEILEDVGRVMRPLVQRESGITLSVHVPSGSAVAWADPDRLRQILMNLVRNAARHTEEGGIIVLSANASEDEVVLQVADTGEGIPPDHVPHVFDRFYRVDEARSRAAGGAGLGLAIVREFVELMNGRVEVDSVPGEGTVFRVHVQRVAEPDIPGPGSKTGPSGQ